MGAKTATARTDGADPRPAERRAVERIAVKGLWCDRGHVIDLSPRGMRLRTYRRWPEGQVRAITVVDGAVSVPVEARCVWCRQEGMFSHLVGLSFGPMPDEQTVRLAEITARRARESDNAGAA